MDPNSIIVYCESNSSWLYTLIWALILPLFFAYIAGAAYAFQRRRSDIAAANSALAEMRALTFFALDRVSGGNPGAYKVRSTATKLVSLVRLEMLHRPEDIQKEILEILKDILINGDIADGKIQDSKENIIGRMTTAEDRIISLIRNLTIFEAFRQAWKNPGVINSFGPLIERFMKQSISNDNEES